MDGLLINTEDIITSCVNKLLEKYERPLITRHIRAQLMGVPDSTNGDVFHDWAKLPISREEFARESQKEMHRQFPNCKPLPGAEEILSKLSSAFNRSNVKIELALASSTKSASYELKTSKSETKHLLGFFPPERRILGDDPRVRKGRGKPAGDIYLLALQALNASAGLEGESAVRPDECLVFEDSVAGVEAGRRAGMRVIWVPHEDLRIEYRSQESNVLAGRTGLIPIGEEHELGDLDDGWAEQIQSLKDFDYEKYGIQTKS